MNTNIYTSGSLRKTFERLQQACGLRGIVCERTRGKIELTTPNGGTTAECATVREAWDTYEGDTTFSSLPVLPIKLGKPAYLNVRHTDGPWKIQDSAGHLSVTCPRQQIAVIIPFPTRAEQIANAKLIEAAPDLISGLEGIVEYASHCKGTDIERVRYLAEAAIRKAKEVA